MKIFHESGYIHSCEKHLIEENKKYWENKTNVTDGSRWIYVFHSVGETFEVCVREDILAKGLQEKTKLPIVAVSCENKMKANDELDRSRKSLCRKRLRAQIRCGTCIFCAWTSAA